MIQKISAETNKARKQMLVDKTKKSLEKESH